MVLESSILSAFLALRPGPIVDTPPKKYELVSHVEEIAPIQNQPANTGAVVSTGSGGDILARIRQCESGGNYATNTGNGYYGAYQFNQSTWNANGGTGNPATASPAEQDRVAQNLYNSRGGAPWPVCSKR